MGSVNLYGSIIERPGYAGAVTVLGRIRHVRQGTYRPSKRFINADCMRRFYRDLAKYSMVHELRCILLMK